MTQTSVPGFQTRTFQPRSEHSLCAYVDTISNAHNTHGNFGEGVPRGGGVGLIKVFEDKDKDKTLLRLVRI